jgi:hypothetical protein
MVAQLLPEFLKLHAACAAPEAIGSLADYFPKSTAVDPQQPISAR